jgi:hypothetical protein
LPQKQPMPRARSVVFGRTSVIQIGGNCTRNDRRLRSPTSPAVKRQQLFAYSQLQEQQRRTPTFNHGGRG